MQKVNILAALIVQTRNELPGMLPIEDEKTATGARTPGIIGRQNYVLAEQG
jgi:hypothetical protein